MEQNEFAKILSTEAARYNCQNMQFLEGYFFQLFNDVLQKDNIIYFLDRQFYAAIFSKITENIKSSIENIFSEKEILKIMNDICDSNKENQDKCILNSIYQKEEYGYLLSYVELRLKELLEEKYDNKGNK